MADEALQAEAEQREHVEASFAGRRWRVPLDVDTWPLETIRQTLGVRADGTVVVNHLAIAQALEDILGEQFDEFVTFAPRRGDLVPASHALAAAVGMPPGGETNPHGERIDRAFGSLPRTLSVLAKWPTAVESDLGRFWGLDYRDRWRFNPDGRRRLTLRQIHTRLQHLPGDSALAVAMSRRSPVELLLMDLYEPLAGRVHPARPLTPEQIAERRAEAEKMRKAKEAYEARRVAQGHRGVAAGLENARANALRGRNA